MDLPAAVFEGGLSMGQRLSVSRAVRMLGVERADLQQLILNGEIETFEGKVDIDELKKLYPILALENPDCLERVSAIRQAAFGRRVKEALLPEKDVLEMSLRRKSTELEVQRSMVKKYRGLLEDMMHKMAELQQQCNEEEKRLLRDLNIWLLERIGR